MRVTKKLALSALAVWVLSPFQAKADNHFKWHGWLEAGYMYQKVNKGPSTTSASFFNREAALGGQAKIGDHEANVLAFAGTGPYSAFYGDATLAAGATALTMVESNIVLKPGFLSGGTWTWGVYRSPFGWEKYAPKDRIFRSTSEAVRLYAPFFTGTNVHFDFGMVWAELHLVSSVFTSGWSVDASKFPGVLLTLGAGSAETFWAKATFGLDKKKAGTQTKNGIALDFNVGAYLMDALTVAGQFYMERKALTSTGSAWAFNIFADYMFTDDLGAGVRFDMNDDKDILFTPGFHYNIAKGITSNLEFSIAKRKAASSYAPNGAGVPNAPATNMTVFYSMAFSF